MPDLKRKMKTNLDIVMLDKCENNSEAAVLLRIVYANIYISQLNNMEIKKIELITSSGKKSRYSLDRVIEEPPKCIL